MYEQWGLETLERIDATNLMNGEKWGRNNI